MTPLAIAFTPNYFVQAAAMLHSLLRSSSGKSRYRVYCLVSEEIPAAMKEKLSRMADGRMEFTYIPLGGKLDGVYTDPRYTEAASFRLLLPELLPEEKSIVYADCDMIIRQDTAVLFSKTELGSNYLAAVFEAPIEDQAERIAKLGCKPGEYFNSGFLIMNLELMRKDSLCGKLLDACKVDWLEFPDQDALNQVCKGRVLPLSPVCNGIRTFFLPQYFKEFKKQYSEYLWYEVRDKGNIHYTGGKPWQLFSVKFADWWLEYEALPDEIKQEWTPDEKVLRLWKIYRTAPGKWIMDKLRAVHRIFR